MLQGNGLMIKLEDVKVSYPLKQGLKLFHLELIVL